MMACWKRNNFVDGLCFDETTSFYSCVEKAQVCMYTGMCCLNQDYFGVIFTVNFVGIMFFDQMQITEMLSFKGIYKSQNHMHSQVITSYLRYCAMNFVNLLI